MIYIVQVDHVGLSLFMQYMYNRSTSAMIAYLRALSLEPTDFCKLLDDRR